MVSHYAMQVLSENSGFLLIQLRCGSVFSLKMNVVICRGRCCTAVPLILQLSVCKGKTVSAQLMGVLLEIDE